jgi:hypothetical protein
MRSRLPRLEDYLSETITVPPETMRDSVSSAFVLPPAQQPRPSPTTTAKAKKR